MGIKGEAVDVDIDGTFGAQVALDEGPNFIEVVASNLQGDQESVILALIYLPVGERTHIVMQDCNTAVMLLMR